MQQTPHQQDEQNRWATVRLPLATYLRLQERAESLTGRLNRKRSALPWLPSEFEDVVRPWHVIERLLRQEELKRDRAQAYRVRKRKAASSAREREPGSTSQS